MASDVSKIFIQAVRFCCRIDRMLTGPEILYYAKTVLVAIKS